MKLKDVAFLSKKILKLDGLFVRNKNIDTNKSTNKGGKHYRLVIIDEENLQESFSAFITRRKIYVFLFICFVLIFFIAIILFSYTPLKAVLPENLNYKEKRKLINLNKKVDSLEALYKLNETFIQQYKNYFVTDPKYLKAIESPTNTTTPIPPIGKWIKKQ